MTANQLEFISLRWKNKTNTILHGIIYLFIIQLVVLSLSLKKKKKKKHETRK